MDKENLSICRDKEKEYKTISNRLKQLRSTLFEAIKQIPTLAKDLGESENTVFDMSDDKFDKIYDSVSDEKSKETLKEIAKIRLIYSGLREDLKKLRGDIDQLKDILGCEIKI